jgi:hypothetical protein
VHKLVDDGDIVFAEQSRNRAEIGHVAALERGHGFDLLEPGELAFEFFVQFVGAVQQAAAAGAVAPILDRFDAGIREPLVAGKPKIVIGREHEQSSAIVFDFALADGVELAHCKRHIFWFDAVQRAALLGEKRFGEQVAIDHCARQRRARHTRELGFIDQAQFIVQIVFHASLQGSAEH